MYKYRLVEESSKDKETVWFTEELDDNQNWRPITLRHTDEIYALSLYNGIVKKPRRKILHQSE